MTKKHLIVVHSIKGGSGKTTISLALAQYFGKNAPGKVCYIDTDIAGVGTIVLVGQGDKHDLSMTDFVLVNPFDNPEFFKTDFEDSDVKLFKQYLYPPDNCRYFHAIFSSVKQDVIKRALQATSDMFFSEDVEKKIKILLEKLYYDGIDTIIVDTSPGMQGLTQVIFKIAKGMNKKGKMHSDENLEVEVINVCVLTNNFAHIGGLWEFLYNERKYYFEDNHQTAKFLLVMNQVPLGVEFKAPGPDLYYDEFQLNEIKEDDPKVREFAGYLKGTIESYGLPLIHRAFREYFRLKAKDFLPTYFKLSDPKALEVSNIDKIGDHAVVIPDQPEIRRIASTFGRVKEFEASLFFKLLEKECETGHLGVLGSRVKDIMESKKEEE